MEDIEKLLSEEEDVKSEGGESSAAPKGDEKTKAENQRLKKVLRERQEEVERLKAEKEALAAEKAAEAAATASGQSQNDAPNSAEEWMKHIEEVAEKKASEKFAAVKAGNIRRAKDKFVSQHPEYANEEKFNGLLSKAVSLGFDSKTDEDEMASNLLDAWAIENRKELEEAAQERLKQRERAQRAAASAASVSEESEKASEDFTESERSEAAKHGLTPERYKKALRMLEESSNETN